MRTSHLTIRSVFHQKMLSARHTDSCAYVHVVILLLQIVFCFTRVNSEYLKFYCFIYAAELICNKFFFCRWLASLLGLIIIGICLMCVSTNHYTEMYMQSYWLICWPIIWTLNIINGDGTVQFKGYIRKCSQGKTAYTMKWRHICCEISLANVNTAIFIPVHLPLTLRLLFSANIYKYY